MLVFSVGPTFFLGFTIPLWRADSRSLARRAVDSSKVCLVHFAKFCKDVKMAFEVLNEIYL